MKIGINALHIVKGKGGGLETYFEGLVSALSKVDTDNTYLIFTNSDYSCPLDLGENFTRVPCNVSASKRVSKVLFEQFVFPVKLRKEKLDVLLSPGNIAPALHPCPGVSIICDMVPFVRPENFSFVERCMLKLLFFLTARTSKKIMTISDYSKSEITRRFSLSPERVEVIFAGMGKGLDIPSEEEAKAVLKGLGIHGPYILSVASSRKYKNIDGLVRAFKLLKDKHKRGELLVIAGHADRAHAELVRLVGDLGLTDDVLFTGFVDDKGLAVLYDNASVFVYPSFFEGFGLPVLEAFSCSTPVAASRAASIPEVAGSGALLFDPHDEGEMAEMIAKILKNKRVREGLQRKGLKQIEEFTWEKTARAALKVMQEVASR